ncbi:Uncharacterised protein [Mycobacterium tuberculosis]|nr:Uncharacterised protein [Mycobacterium tuberculosis]CKT96407.1 Uncharacterised protein [Mycobacterium tuberculosis]
MSIPLDTPAAVMTRSGRCSTTRWGTYRAPSELNRSCTRQCVVAVKPLSSPAAANTSPPVHTEVVSRVCRCASRTQSSTVWSWIRVRVPMPPGKITTSGRVSSSNAASHSRPSMALSLRTSPRRWPTNTTSNDGTRCSTSKGPTASSAVLPGKSAIATCIGRPLSRMLVAQPGTQPRR